MRFSPLDPEMFRMQAGMALSHLFAGRFDTALSWAEQSFRELPTFVASLPSLPHVMRLPAELSKRGLP